MIHLAWLESWDAGYLIGASWAYVAASSYVHGAHVGHMFRCILGGYGFPSRARTLVPGRVKGFSVSIGHLSRHSDSVTGRGRPGGRALLPMSELKRSPPPTDTRKGRSKTAKASQASLTAYQAS